MPEPEIKKEEVKAVLTPAKTARPPKNVFRRSGRGPSREGRVKSEFDQKTLEVRRVTRVIAGGKRFNFSVALAAGNRKGSIGIGVGKGADTALAIDKAARDAKKNMVKINFTKTSSIAHRVEAKYSSAVIMLQPSPGRGIIAGSAVRTVIELAGIKDVVGKIFSGSKNKLNIARATVKALAELPNTQT